MFNTYENEHIPINDNDIDNCESDEHSCVCFYLIRGY